MSEIIPVSTSSADHYKITIGKDIIEDLTAFVIENYGKGKVIVLIDQKVYTLHREYIDSNLESAFSKVVKFMIPEGEKSKSLEMFDRLMDHLLEEGIERKTPVLAIGGGVIGDLAGFVAASALRGLPLIHVPTSLLAMVDSSIGGKTGINHSTGKNLIGAFYQPVAVYADVRFLDTLPQREWVSGLSEIIKYGMIENPEILGQVQNLIKDGVFAEPQQWIPVIAESAGIKADIVNRDVKESGVREFLNFGHTFAHVIEKAGEYTKYSHGEAVFAGMYGAVRVSTKLGADIDSTQLDHFKSLYSISFKGITADADAFTTLMLRDKKAKNNTIRLILLKELGKPIVRPFENTESIKESWNYIFNTFN